MKKITSTFYHYMVAVALLVTPMVVPVSVASAQSVAAETLNADIKRLRRDLRDLQQLMFQKSGNNDAVDRIKSEVNSNVYEQMNAIDESINDLARRLENVEGQNKQSTEKVDKLNIDVNFRLQELSDQLKQVTQKAEQGEQDEKMQAVSQEVATLKQTVESQKLIIAQQAELIKLLNTKIDEAVNNSNKAIANSDMAINSSNQALAGVDTLSKKVAQNPTTPKTAQAKKPATQVAKAPEKSLAKPTAKPETA